LVILTYSSTVFILFLKVICDAHFWFLSVNATKPGSCHDSTVFKGSVKEGNLLTEFSEMVSFLGTVGIPEQHT
jgi:hypothetical protein